jgi:hypothetical protein
MSSEWPIKIPSGIQYPNIDQVVHGDIEKNNAEGSGSSSNDLSSSSIPQKRSKEEILQNYLENNLDEDGSVRERLQELQFEQDPQLDKNDALSEMNNNNAPAFSDSEKLRELQNRYGVAPSEHNDSIKTSEKADGLNTDNVNVGYPKFIANDNPHPYVSDINGKVEPGITVSPDEMAARSKRLNEIIHDEPKQQTASEEPEGSLY